MENGGRNILVIDDDPILRDALGQHYTQRPVKFFSAATFSEGLRICARNKIDIVLLDPRLTDGKSGRLYSDIRSYNDQTKIILTTAHPGFGSAVEALQVGAHAYVPKPFHMKEMDRAIATALRTLALERVELLQNYIKRKEIETTVLVGSDPCLVELHRMVDAAANSSAPVMITGETGTGKALVARAIHYRSRVKNNPYVTVDCCALAADRIESELFGYDKAEYTGAISPRKGFFELAGSGTLFLDAIGELPLHLQSKLLAAVDNKKVTRLGGQTSRHIEARVIAATHIDLEKAVRSKHFSSDLYDRFYGLRIHVPPLREHRGDVPELCSFFIETISPSNHLEIRPEDLQVMMAYDWPGNVRELRNVIERSIMLRQGPVLRPAEMLYSHHAHNAQLPAAQRASSAAIVPMKAVEKEHIRQALKVMSNNHSQTAKALGISRSTLIRKMKAYGI
jgi:DNA-binding NtrC family response regulator